MSVILHTSVGDIHIDLHCVECPKASFNFLALCASGYYDGTKFTRCIPGVLIQGGDPTGTGRGGHSVYAFRHMKKKDDDTAIPLPVPLDDDIDNDNEGEGEGQTGASKSTTAQKHSSSPSSSSSSISHSNVIANQVELPDDVADRYFSDEGFGITSHARRGVVSMAHKGKHADTNASQFFILFTPQPSLDGMYSAFGQVRLPQQNTGGDTNRKVGGAAASSSSSLLSGDGSVKVDDMAERIRSEDTLRRMQATVTDKKGGLPQDSRAIIVNGCTVTSNPFAQGLIRMDVV